MEPEAKADRRFSSGEGVAAINPARLAVARLLGIVGLLVYNWWILVPFKPGLLPSTDGFFSDLEANGRPYSAVMQHLDLLAGVLLVIALVLRGPMGRHSDRREWPWMVVFAAAGAVGGKFAYACAEGMSASCRHREWRFQLPLHHYIHIASGIVEFGAITIGLVIAYRRTRGETSIEANVFLRIATLLILGYPILGVAYLGDRWGALVEPVFFLTFTLIILVELFEPAQRLESPDPTP